MTHLQTTVRPDHTPAASWRTPQHVDLESMTLEDSLARIGTRLRWYGFQDWFIAGAAVTDRATVSAALADGDGRPFVVLTVDRRSGTVRPTVLDLKPLRESTR